MTSTSSTYLYRILGFNRVIDMLESKQLHFVSPSTWEDPYEKVLVHERSHAFFAQCWSTKAASDAMWRIYSLDRTSVRIRTTRSKLSDALLEHKKRNDIDYLIEDVEYLPSSEVNARLLSTAKSLKENYQARRAADALLIKRDAFDHESEVRVVVHDKTLQIDAAAQKHIRVPINPEVLIDSIFFDPRADEAYIKMCKYYLENHLKYKGTVRKSALYRTRDPIDART